MVLQFPLQPVGTAGAVPEARCPHARHQTIRTQRGCHVDRLHQGAIDVRRQSLKIRVVSDRVVGMTMRSV